MGNLEQDSPLSHGDWLTMHLFLSPTGYRLTEYRSQLYQQPDAGYLAAPLGAPGARKFRASATLSACAVRVPPEPVLEQVERQCTRRGGTRRT